MVVTFGWKAPEFVVPLPRLGDYLFALQAPTAWPAGAAVTLRFYRTPEPADDPEPLIWPAALAGVLATWHVSAAQVLAVRTAGARHVWLVYVNANGIPLEWMAGTVQVT